MTCTRGTTNKNISGSARARRAQKRYLLETFRADVDVLLLGTSQDDTDRWKAVADEVGSERMVYVGRIRMQDGTLGPEMWTVPLGHGEIATRCYRCGDLLVFCTLERDRIVPGKRGGTYVRANIRPCCGGCNTTTGNYERWGNAPAFNHHVNAETE